jgi:enoyl-CoA hydratase
MNDVTLAVADHVATVTLDRAAARNRLSKALMESLVEVCTGLADRDDVRVVVFQAAGADFSTGADLTDPGMRAIAQAPLGERRRLLLLGPRLVEGIQALPHTTIAAVQGYCLGGGACIPLACDLRIAAADLKLGMPEVLRGMNMSWHSVALMVAELGPARTKELLITGRLVDAATALAWGLVNRTSAAGATAVQAAAAAWARELIASVPPIQASMIKETVNVIANAHTPMLHMDRDQFVLAQMTEDFGEAIRAFVEKRPPRFRGR